MLRTTYLLSSRPGSLTIVKKKLPWTPGKGGKIDFIWTVARRERDSSRNCT